jgi:hypothetical protein
MTELSEVVGSYAGYVSLGLFILGAIYGAVNHKRLRSKCCGRNVEASLDIEQTTPPRDKPPVSV